MKKKLAVFLGIFITSGVAFGQANTSLSNLTTTSVNESLLADSTANNRDLGGWDHFWNLLWAKTFYVRNPGNASQLIGTFGPTQDLPSGSETDIVAIRGVYSTNSAASSASAAVHSWSDSGNTGHIYIESGNSSSGNSGNILMRTGSANSTRGHIKMDALYVELPQGTSDPTAPAGSAYYNTSTNKMRLFDGTSWVSLN